MQTSKASALAKPIRRRVRNAAAYVAVNCSSRADASGCNDVLLTVIKIRTGHIGKLWGIKIAAKQGGDASGIPHPA
jgi:hypothetical protein